MYLGIVIHKSKFLLITTMDYKIEKKWLIEFSTGKPIAEADNRLFVWDKITAWFFFVVDCW